MYLDLSRKINPFNFETSYNLLNTLVTHFDADLFK